MTTNTVVTRERRRLTADTSRVIARLFVPGREGFEEQESRAGGVLTRILALSDDDVRVALDDVLARFGGRHRDLDETFRRHARELADRLGLDHRLGDARKALLGATFTSEYAVEAAALCNPSVVAAPDQSGLAAGSLRIVMSVRGIGEGHRSSIGFCTGVVDAAGGVTTDDRAPFTTTGRVERMDLDTNVIRAALAESGDTGGTVDAGAFVRRVTARCYTVDFPACVPLSERLLWPAVDAEQAGMEDARFVRFVDDDGSATYLATYTAYSGSHISQQLLQTNDFRMFTSTPLVGRAAANKGLALFPRRIDGRYVALSRSDRETNSVAFAEHPAVWPSSSPCQQPTEAWEALQLGNCGSPIETDSGWLVLTHGVGPMRTYSIGALLLDLDDPTMLIGRLRRPLLSPVDDEQNGYVPNVVYSCGALAHAGTLVIPYGIADSAIGIATVPLDDLLTEVTESPT